ncbi:MAG TPA: tail fiber domain-containing protein [Candidatus Sulfotelmatobacter sp.]|nr:tail fiber domain-containing protein [Candidatus Sulfotelmatobacter sp.]
MKNRVRNVFTALAMAALLALNLQSSIARAQGTAFTYQGRVTDNGTNFNGTGQFKFALATGINVASQATATANPPSGGFITVINVVSGGNGYTTTPAVTISGGGGSGATATASISGGAVTSITVSYPGSGYTSTPTVTVAAPPPDIDYTTYWSNDGTSEDGSEPSSAVSVSVSQGLFTVILGNTALANMTAIPASIFNTQTNLQLMIWFNDGVNGFALLNPPQSLTPIPQATFANNASNLLGAVSATQLSGPVPSGDLTSVPAASLTGPVQNSQLANSSITVNAGTGLSGGGAVALGGSTTLNNAGVTALTGGDGVTVSASSGAVTLGLGGTLDLPALPVTINSAGNLLMYADNNGNFFNGPYAGNLTTGNDGGFYNTANGYEALRYNTSGYDNTANGTYALYYNMNGLNNTANGAYALYCNTSGFYNTANGALALYYNTSGYDNTANGYGALEGSGGSYNTAVGYEAMVAANIYSYNTAVGAWALSHNTGYNNTAVGYQALSVNTSGWANEAFGYWALSNNVSGVQNIAIGDYALVTSTNGSQNTAMGSGAMQYNVNGSADTAVGFHALWQLGNTSGKDGGTNNIAIGYLAAANFTGNESSNIDIGNYGTTGDNNIIRIGSTQTATYLVGNVYTPSGTVESSCDRNLKENFIAINPQTVLDRVASLPLSEWNYKTDKNVEHIGPVAQDFHAAFGLNGSDDKHISVVDEGGVALAAIQGLNQKLEEQGKEKDAEIVALKKQNDLLAQRLNDLAQTVKTLAQKN